MSSVMLEKFIDHQFRKASLDRIAQANAIIEEYSSDGLTLTLRQLYYQFVARGIIENTERSYKKLGSLVSKAREAGHVPWDAIEDRGRKALKVRGESDPRDVVHGLESQIVIDPWDEQKAYPEVWIEKDALVGTIERVCHEYRVTYMACRGYLSASEAWRAGQRFNRAVMRGKKPLIIHLGDHDPSGLDMTRDNEARSSLFSRFDVPVRRIALNMDQVEEFKPPPNPAKITDTRAGEYIRLHGGSSWELDALEPRTLADLVRHELDACISDRTAWKQVADREEAAKTHLGQLYERWDDIVDLLEVYNG